MSGKPKNSDTRLKSLPDLGSEESRALAAVLQKVLGELKDIRGDYHHLAYRLDRYETLQRQTLTEIENLRLTLKQHMVDQLDPVRPDTNPGKPSVSTQDASTPDSPGVRNQSPRPLHHTQAPSESGSHRHDSASDNGKQEGNAKPHAKASTDSSTAARQVSDPVDTKQKQANLPLTWKPIKQLYDSGDENLAVQFYKPDLLKVKKENYLARKLMPETALELVPAANETKHHYLAYPLGATYAVVPNQKFHFTEEFIHFTGLYLLYDYAPSNRTLLYAVTIPALMVNKQGEWVLFQKGELSFEA